ncbi:MAG: methyltransferase domain-containing protein [Acidobacteriaceae bacterium]
MPSFATSVGRKLLSMDMGALIKGGLRRVGVSGLSNDAVRTQWVEQTLKQLPAGGRLLDAGCGEQQYRPLCSHLVYTGQDFAQYDGQGDGCALQTGTWDQSKVEIISDIMSIPAPDQSFDAIMCTEVLEHVPDPAGVVVELNRLLKTGGYLLLTAPFCSLSHFTPFHFSTGLSRYWYQKHLGDLGIEITEIEPNGNYFEYLAQELWRLPSVTKQWCNRAAFVALVVPLFLLTVPLILALSVLAKSGGKSSDLLCFGYHVLARKK